MAIEAGDRDAGRDQAAFFIRLLERLGCPVQPGTCVLDFGCGNGSAVKALMAAGLDAYGCDYSCELGTGERLRVIEEPYRLPFGDASFDVIISSQVFEHVQEYDVALKEIRRVLRPGGISLHTFPARWSPLEPHCFVPLATVIRARSWLLLWAKLGVRNRFQRGTSAAEVASLNQRFLRESTTYYGRRKLMRKVRAVFADARLLCVEPLAAGSSRRMRAAYPLARRIPVVAFAYSELRSRTLLLR